MSLEQRYTSPRALEQAVKAAARKNGTEDRAMEDFVIDRFLARVFSEKQPGFVLKGGRSMLARLEDARRTKDVDFASTEVSLTEAQDELERLGALNLGDFLEFRLAKTVPILEGQEYRDGIRLTFEPVFGKTKHMSPFSVDVVLGDIVFEEAETIIPVSRLDIQGLPVFDYVIYPIEGSLADKICATLTSHDGIESSRVKDLVDLVVYLSHFALDGTAVSQRVAREIRLRRMNWPTEFEIPSQWLTIQKNSYAKIAAEAKLPVPQNGVEGARELAKRFADPIFAGAAQDKIWNPELLDWEERR